MHRAPQSVAPPCRTLALCSTPGIHSMQVSNRSQRVPATVQPRAVTVAPLVAQCSAFKKLFAVSAAPQNRIRVAAAAGYNGASTVRTFDFRYNADKQAYLEEACARFTNLKTEVIATYVNSTAATLRGELEKRLIPAASRLVQAQILDLLLDSLNGTAKALPAAAPRNMDGSLDMRTTAGKAAFLQSAFKAYSNLDKQTISSYAGYTLDKIKGELRALGIRAPPRKEAALNTMLSHLNDAAQKKAKEAATRAPARMVEAEANSAAVQWDMLKDEAGLKITLVIPIRSEPRSEPQ